MTTYIDQFPLPVKSIPTALKELLSIEDSTNPSQKITVTARVEKNRYIDGYEYFHMIMATVPAEKVSSLKVLAESVNGVVKSSRTNFSEFGSIYPVNPSISNYDYIVASWGDGSHFSYSLSEKVWMTLGLSPRVIGNAEQKIIYDDLSFPILRVAEGDLATERYETQKNPVKWLMLNDYLRKYLWMTGCYGVRVFYYEAYIHDSPEIQLLMGEEQHFSKTLGDGWCEVEIRKFNGRLLLQVHASVPAIKPELCQQQDKHSLIWVDDTQPMTEERLHTREGKNFIYLDDKVLEKYEKDSIFEAVVFRYYDRFYTSPSYKGQWTYQDCERIGRNMLRVPLYELYRNLPDQEIYHAHRYAIPSNEALSRDSNEEHIVAKSERFLKGLCQLGVNLAVLQTITTGEYVSSSVFIEFVVVQTLSDNGLRIAGASCPIN